MRDFFEEHFNSILIAGLFLILVGVTLIIIFHRAEPGVSAWAEDLTKQFATALFTLTVAKRLASGNGDTPKPPAPIPNPPVEPPPHA
jgi:hypothetical protein